MSFSSKIKNEILHHTGETKEEKIAEIAAIMNMCGNIVSHGNKKNFIINTENALVARKFFTLVKDVYDVTVEISIRRSMQLHKNRVYILYIHDNDAVNKILGETEILGRHKINEKYYRSTEVKRAYIRGVFLSSGSISDPEKGYHLEFVDKDLSHLEEFQDLLNTFELGAKIVERKNNYVLYVKEAEQIVTILNVMTAFISLMDFENIRILKDMRNNVNRIVNCETANLNKTVNAAIKQLNDIQLIDESVGVDALQESLKVVALARIENPNVSLKELGEMIGISKSAINHRFRKLHEIAEQYK